MNKSSLAFDAISLRRISSLTLLSEWCFKTYGRLSSRIKWSSHAKEVQEISVHNERNLCLFLSFYANETLKIVGNN